MGAQRRERRSPGLAIPRSPATRAWLGGALLFTAFLLALRALDVNTLLLGRDPTAAADVAPWFGALSQLGLMLWAGSVGVCLLGAALLRALRAPQASYLFGTVALAALLGVDDAYLIHEAVMPESVGVPEPVIYLFLGGSVVAWLWSFRDRIAESDWPLLLFAATSMAASVGIDYVGSIPALLEDATKYVAIGAFATWCFCETLRLLKDEAGVDGASERRRRPPPAGATPPPAR